MGELIDGDCRKFLSKVLVLSPVEHLVLFRAWDFQMPTKTTIHEWHHHHSPFPHPLSGVVAKPRASDKQNISRLKVQLDIQLREAELTVREGPKSYHHIPARMQRLLIGVLRTLLVEMNCDTSNVARIQPQVSSIVPSDGSTLDALNSLGKLGIKSIQDHVYSMQHCLYCRVVKKNLEHRRLLQRVFAGFRRISLQVTH